MWRLRFSGPMLAAALAPCELSAAASSRSSVLLRRWASTVRMTKQLQKMLNRGAGSKKKKFFSAPVNPALGAGVGVSPHNKSVGYTEGQKRRAVQVGRVLYDNIVHLINTGAVCDKLAAQSVEIVRVKVVPDFSVVKVYWLSSGDKENDHKVQTLLNDSAGHLRQLLTSLYVLGTIPRISFVRDDSQMRYMEVQALLHHADFGPDFVPTTLDTPIRDNPGAGSQQERAPAPEEVLQERFNALNVTASSNSAEESQRISFSAEQKSELQSEFGEKVSLESSEHDKVLSSLSADSQRTLSSAEEKPRFESEFGEKVSLESSSSSSSSSSKRGKADSVSSRIDSEVVQSREIQQDSASRASLTQPSSMEVNQLGSQFLSAAGGGGVPSPGSSASLEETSATLSKEFRDDVYKVPHSDLWNKVLAKKERAGVRLSRPMMLDVCESETVVTTEPQDLKSALLKKKLSKSKLRLKMQSHYFEDFVVRNAEEDYFDDEDHYGDNDDLDHDDGGDEIVDDIPSGK